MARPVKVGLKYFPFDVDFFNDEKIEAISGEFGIKGEIVAIKLLCAVYRNGYFIEWSEMLQMKLLKQLPSISTTLLEQILSRLIKWGFFDETLFNSARILTSKGIQKRYFEAMKRNSLSDSLPFLLVSVTKTRVNVTETPINVAKTTQKKEKENKVNVLLEKEPKYIHIGEDENFSENSEELKISEEKKEKISPQPPKKRKSFLSQEELGEFASVWYDWLEYKQTLRKSYKSEKSERIGFRQLVALADNSPEIAQKIAEQSIANTWTGLFELKQNFQPKKQNGQAVNTTGYQPNTNGYQPNNYQPNAPASNRKISAREFLAQKYFGQFANDNSATGAVIDVEAHEL